MSAAPVLFHSVLSYTNAMQGVHGFAHESCVRLVGEVLEDGIFALQDALQAAHAPAPDRPTMLRALAAAEIIAALLQHSTKHLPKDPELCAWVEDYGYVELDPLPQQAREVIALALAQQWQHTCAVSKQAKRQWQAKMLRLSHTLSHSLAQAEGSKTEGSS